MAALKHVAVSLPEDKSPTKSMLRDVVGTFLTKEWPFVDPDSLTTSYHTSFTNANCHVQRPRPATGAPEEPLKVFIKFHNDITEGFEIFKHLVPSKQAEAVLCHEYAQTGQGALMYGFFQTKDGTLGRIDEFLDARNMEPEDVEDAAIRSDVSEAFALFHTMKTSLKLQPVELFYDNLIHGLNKYKGADKLKSLGKEGGVNVDRLIDYDFGTRVRRVADKLASTRAKLGLCIHDVQFMNVLVRNELPTNEVSRVILIDFEFALRNYRAFDIGGHFMQKMFKWFDNKSKIAKCRKYTEEEKKHFCEVYARRWNQSTGDSDTAEEVFVESEYGYMLAIAFDVHNMLCFMDETDDKDPLNLLALNKLLGEFMAQYAKMGLDYTLPAM